MKHQKKHVKRMISRKHRSGERTRVKSAPPRTLKQYWAMSERDRNRYDRSVHAVTDMRSARVSLRKAAQKYKISAEVVARLAGPALRKKRNGRYVARQRDKLLRNLVLPKRGAGLREIATRDSREASKAAEYWNALHRYLSTGDASAIRQFNREYITDASGSKIRLLTDLKELDRQGNAGNLSFESIYPK